MMQLLSKFNALFTLFLVFPAIVVLGVYLTCRLKFVQIFKLKMSMKQLFAPQEGGTGSITHYQAVASVLASNFGTGNISGMAIALTMGGPGALFWMWVMAFLGAAIQYASCLLGVKYRRQNSRGEYVGGPMYYLSEGLGFKKVALLFSAVVILAAFAVGNFAQVNSIALPLSQMGIAPWITGVALAFFVGLVILGGVSRVAHVSATVVPVMAALYLGTALVILVIHASEVGPAIGMIVRSAFGFSSAAGGVVGFGMMRALGSGFDRAIFATDAGTGTVPILQSGAKTTHPVIDGVVSILAPFLVMIVCSATALVLIVTGIYGEGGIQSTNMVAEAFGRGVSAKVGPGIVVIALILFGYTTTLAWASCLQKAVGFLFGGRMIKPFYFLYILMVPLGAMMQVGFVWLLADVALTSMMVINLIGVVGLSKEVIGDSERYFDEVAEQRV